MTFHPWRELRNRPHLQLEMTKLPGSLKGALTGDIVWIDQGLLQRERRCTVLHEILHHEHGHEGCQPSAVEAQIREQVARLLIPMPLLLDKLAWTESLEELAEELWVDDATLMARLDTLTADERAQIVALHERIEHAA